MDQILIIGAPRSGTNMLRDMLVNLSGLGTWPCDEINYIWRHGNIRFPSDEFTSEMATPKVQRYINDQFEKLAKTKGLNAVVEKTCANSLRIEYVERILPESKYVFIVRDGMDVVGSALQRWTASLDVSYLLQKARFVPPTDLPYYALRYLSHRVYRLVSRENRLALWGPAMDDLDILLERHSLTEVCALQWKACVDKAEHDLEKISQERVIKIKYEEFVRDPVREFARLSDFLGVRVSDTVNDYLRKNVSPYSVGKGRSSLGEAEVKKLEPLIASTLKRYGYE
jgi:hypothetical protein